MGIQLEQYWQRFNLQPSQDLGCVVWKHDNGLRMAIVVGQDEYGEKYVIHNQPKKRNFSICSLAHYQQDSYCFFDMANDSYDRARTTMQAFVMLHKYNETNEQKYNSDYKFELVKKEKYQMDTLDFEEGLWMVLSDLIGIKGVENRLRKSWNKIAVVAGRTKKILVTDYINEPLKQKTQPSISAMSSFMMF